MATPAPTPLPPTLEAVLARELASGLWSQVTRQFFLDLLKSLRDLEAKVLELETRLEVLEP